MSDHQRCKTGLEAIPSQTRRDLRSSRVAWAQAAAVLRARLDEIVELVCAGIPAAEVPIGNASEYQAGRKAAVEAVVEYSLDAIEHEPDEWPPIPGALIEQAQRAAGVGLRQGVLVQYYLEGHKRFVLLLKDAIQDAYHADAAALLEQLHLRFRPLRQHIVTEMERGHDREHRRMDQSPERRRAALARSLLSEALGPRDLKELGYDVHHRWHICMIAASHDVAGRLQKLARQHGASLLVVAGEDETVWVWLGTLNPMSAAELKRMLARTGRLDQLPIAHGDASQSLKGWRETHHEATLALPIARHRGRLTRCADYLPVVTAAQDEATVRMYYERYIAPLARLQKGAAILKTLQAYVEHGQSPSSAAQAIGVTRQTVARHLRKAPQLLGEPLNMTALTIAIHLREFGYMAHIGSSE